MQLYALLFSITIRFRKNSKFIAFVVKNATQKLTATLKKFADHNIRVSTDNKTLQFVYRRKGSYHKIPRLLFFNTHPYISILSLFKKSTFDRPDFRYTSLCAVHRKHKTNAHLIFSPKSTLWKK